MIGQVGRGVRLALGLCIASLVAAANPVRAETYFSGSTIVAMCEAPGETSPAVGKRNLCAFYLTAVSDGLVTSSLYGRAPGDTSPMKPVLCLPDNVAIATLTDALTSFAKAHPDRLRGSAASLAADALAERYACPGAKDANGMKSVNGAKGSKPDVVFFSAGDMMRRCTDADALTGLYCLYYVVGVSDLYAALAAGADPAFAEQICYPKTMPDDQPRRSFVAFATAHPEASGDNGALTAARALHAAFPCKARR